MAYDTIKLNTNGGGRVVYDYVYLASQAISDDSELKSVGSEPSGWDNNTLMYSKFNGDLAAGNSEMVDAITEYEVRRGHGLDGGTKYIGKIVRNTKFIIDYLSANNTKYTYYLYPGSRKGQQDIFLDPLVSKEVKPEWEYWSLIVADETEDENVLYMSKVFKFGLNIQDTSMNNNAQVTVSPNFTRYPTVQIAPSNYWSGTLSSLIGYINCGTGDYTQTPNMVDELKELTTDTRRKFLKDIEGHVWEVKITAPIDVTNEETASGNIKTVTVGWTEIGVINDISVINNPDTPTTEWVLTETGEYVPYVSYIWDDDAIWNDEHYWTGRDDILETQASNMGREINEGGGE